ncbi:MAG: PQQ-binding-like beta-propeller repeat protein [Planctomycetota bacterium]
MTRPQLLAPALLASAALLSAPASASQAVDGWLSWRGPFQNGTSSETGLPDTIEAGGESELWTYDLRGRGTPAIADGRVFVFGYEGENADLQEVLVCLNEADGTRLWEHRFSDFLSDVIYDRYSIGAPTVDPETGDVFLFTSGGLVSRFSPEGQLRWQHSLMSEFGRLTFPNGRIGAPLIAEDKVIVHFISTSWGPQGPARDRFFAFDKDTGYVVWTATPGVGPKDSSFSYPVLAERGGRLMLYAGTGCGNIVSLDARTGDLGWRCQVSIGGVNSAVVVYGDRLIAIHGKENLDTSTIGRMFSLPLDPPATDGRGPTQLDASAEFWRADLVAFSSSPVLVGDRVYQTVATGDLYCLDAASGEAKWHVKLAPDQIHASPVYGDGKLYVPMNNGTFHVVRPTDEGPEIVCQTELAGSCLGAPAIAGGRVYVHTTEKLYCFGKPGSAPTAGAAVAAGGNAFGTARGEAGEGARLQIVPAEILLRPGDKVPMDARLLDANGHQAGSERDVAWDAGALGVRVDVEGVLHVPNDAQPGTGVLKGTAGELSSGTRIRIVPHTPTYDFDTTELKPHPKHEGVAYADPPSHWIGAKLKWEVRELDGQKVLAKTLDNSLFQRSTSLFGHPDMSNYTVQVDVMTDGNRRSMSTAGVLNQRYLIQLKGNYQQIEVSSNMERIKESVPFKIRPGTWYTLKTRVDLAEDGSGVVRAKAWKRGEPEPEAWNIEVEHKDAHRSGSPGLFGFAPQSRFHVYVDNLSVTPND